jgi:hypothetical protein
MILIQIVGAGTTLVLRQNGFFPGPQFLGWEIIEKPTGFDLQRGPLDGKTGRRTDVGTDCRFGELPIPEHLAETPNAPDEEFAPRDRDFATRKVALCRDPFGALVAAFAQLGVAVTPDTPVRYCRAVEGTFGTSHLPRHHQQWSWAYSRWEDGPSRRERLWLADISPAVRELFGSPGVRRHPKDEALI